MIRAMRGTRAIRKIVAQVKSAQAEVRKLMKERKTIAAARRQTKKLRDELGKYLSDDIARLTVFIDRARDELEALRKLYLRGPRRQPGKVRVKSESVRRSE